MKNDRTEPADNSIAGKVTVWYETCVDSPVISRKKLSKSQSIDQPRSNNVYPMNNLNTQCANVNLIDRAAERRLTESVVPFESPKNQTVIQPATIQPYREISKPFEMSDFYKFSTKFKKQVSNVKIQLNLMGWFARWNYGESRDILKGWQNDWCLQKELIFIITGLCHFNRFFLYI